MGGGKINDKIVLFRKLNLFNKKKIEIEMISCNG